MFTKSRSVKCCPSTIADYERKFNRMIKTGFRPEDSSCRQTFYAYRAALMWNICKLVRISLRDRDAAKFESPEWNAAVSKLKSARIIFQLYGYGIVGGANKSAVAGTVQYSPVTSESRNRSKKHLLVQLGKIPNWRARIFHGIPAKYKAALAVCYLAGVRPCELAKGVEVQFEAGTLILAIKGAKLTSDSGQSVRVLEIKSLTDEARLLATMAATKPIVITCNAQALCSAVERAGKRDLPELRGLLSPYVYRHLFASGLKSDGMEPVKIAKALGHRTTKSQSSYGRACHGRQGSSLLAVFAVSQVKQNHRKIDDMAERWKPLRPSLTASWSP